MLPKARCSSIVNVHGILLKLNYVARPNFVGIIITNYDFVTLFFTIFDIMAKQKVIDNDITKS